ncbi:hypothetical protein [Paludisphaera rhizosphaerae]|nr:hypothetical protein [Paludisphaera rhizosphaerae]
MPRSRRNWSTARASVFEYIEVFYNRVQRHSSVGYKFPDKFERS